MKRAVVLGATGLVGSELVRQLLEDERIECVRLLLRRPSGQRAARIDERVVDFERPESWQGLIEGDVLFSAMGTTRKAAGSQEAQWRVDHDYQLWAAKAAAKNGVGRYVLVSSTGASARSPLFYSRMKGELEEQVRSLPFHSVTVLRPSLLEGDRKEDRPGERWALRVLGRVPSRLIPSSLRPVEVTRVAMACRAAAERGGERFEIWEADQVQQGGPLPRW